MEPSLGSLIREKRESKGWSQEQLAEKVGVDSRTILRIETGETKTPQPYTLKRIVEVLGITPDELESVNKRGRAKKVESAPQISDIASDNDESVTPVMDMSAETTTSFASMPREAPEDTRPSHTEREPKPQPRWLILSLTIITIAVLLI